MQFFALHLRKEDITWIKNPRFFNSENNTMAQIYLTNEIKQQGLYVYCYHLL